MGAALATEEMIADARAATGLERFDSESFREGLDILVADVNADTERPEAAVAINRGMFTKALIDHLKVANAIAERPEVLEAPVERPVFVFGVPRSGTTLLSNLLGADPARRSLLKWELDDPVPPPTTKTLYTDPRAIAALEAEKQLFAAYPEAGRIYRMSAVYPYEDVAVMAHDFKTLMWESAGKLPHYRDWLFSTDVSSAYVYHKKFVQLHQADAPGIWNFKMPSHALNLETLIATYPDARLVWAHRDPYAATASFCSIISAGHRSMAGRLDTAWIAENMPWQARQHAERAMASRARIGHDRVIDVHYAEMMRDPIAAMRGLYKALGDDFTAEAEAGMTAWLADNPQGKFGRHEYKLDQYGLSKAALEPVFEAYLAQYDIEPEG